MKNEKLFVHQNMDNADEVGRVYSSRHFSWLHCIETQNQQKKDNNNAPQGGRNWILLGDQSSYNSLNLRASRNTSSLPLSTLFLRNGKETKILPNRTSSNGANICHTPMLGILHPLGLILLGISVFFLCLFIKTVKSSFCLYIFCPCYPLYLRSQ